MEARPRHPRRRLRVVLALAGALALGLVLKPLLPVAAPGVALLARRFSLPPESETRERILAHVKRHPGATIVEVAADARVTHPTAKYHLDILERAGAIQSRRMGNKRLYFPRPCALDEWDLRFLSLLRSEEAATVLSTVVTNPWTYPKEVAEREGMSRLTVASHARALQDLGLLHSAREGRTRSLVADKHLLTSRGSALAAKLPQGDAARHLLEALVRGL